MYNQNLKGAKLAPLGVFQKLMIYVVPGTPFSSKILKSKKKRIFANIPGIIISRVYIGAYMVCRHGQSHGGIIFTIQCMDHTPTRSPHPKQKCKGSNYAPRINHSHFHHCLLVTSVYSQVLIYTAESTGASMERTKMPNFRNGS